jgi:glycosyltransferase involved in cell wall biosynthesis
LKRRVLILVVAYNAERTITDVLSRVPINLAKSYATEALVIDDCSRDSTFKATLSLAKSGNCAFPITALTNPSRQGYGSTQKIGYQYAIQHGFEFVAPFRCDCRCSPECLPLLLRAIEGEEAAAVLGCLSRGLRKRPGLKLICDYVADALARKILRLNLSDLRSGCRVYSTSALQAVPFGRCSAGPAFETEIIVQLLNAGLIVREVPLNPVGSLGPRHARSFRDSGVAVWTALQARLQHAGLLYDRKFDCQPPHSSPYEAKLDYDSPHSFAFDRIRHRSKVLDLGCASGYLAARLVERKQCVVDGVDTLSAYAPALRRLIVHDLNLGMPRIEYKKYDYFVILDVIEHLIQPEVFLDNLRVAVSESPAAEVLVSTANVAFFVTRFMLLLGQFNYGRRGILDITHTRLFTFGSFEKIVKQAGFQILEQRGIPGPFPLALGYGLLSRMLLRVNHLLIHVSRGLFSYQIFFRVKPQPSLESILDATYAHSQSLAKTTSDKQES